MKEISMVEQKTIMLGIMDYIDNFCRKNDITYYLIGGTLLGAVRHKGYIPWDDDIDIGLLRNDYERLIKEFNKSNNLRYRLLSLENDSDYALPMAKIIDTRTVLDMGIPGHKPIGVFVDIFPIDYCPDEYDKAKCFVQRPSLFRKLTALKNAGSNPDRSFIKSFIIYLVRFLSFAISRRLLAERINSLASANKKNTSTDYVAEIVLMPYGEKEIFRREWFDETVELEFEGRMYFAPRDYDKMLRRTFGEYMILPPMDKRITHHGSSAFWKE